MLDKDGYCRGFARLNPAFRSAARNMASTSFCSVGVSGHIFRRYFGFFHFVM